MEGNAMQEIAIDGRVSASGIRMILTLSLFFACFLSIMGAESKPAAIKPARPSLIERSAGVLPEPFVFPREAKAGALESRGGLCREEWPSFASDARAEMRIRLAPVLPFKCPLLTVRLGGEFSYFPAEECQLFPPGSPNGRKDKMLVHMGSLKILMEPEGGGEGGEPSLYRSVNYAGKTLRREGEKFIYEDREDGIACAFFSLDAGTTWRLDWISGLRVPGTRMSCEWGKDGTLKSLRLPGGEAWTIESKGGAPLKITDPWGAFTELSWDSASHLKGIKTSLPAGHPLYPKPKAPVVGKPKPYIFRDIHVEHNADAKLASLVNTFGEKFVFEYRSDKDEKARTQLDICVMTLPDGTKRYCRANWKLGISRETDEGWLAKGPKGEEVFDSERKTLYRMKGTMILPVAKTINQRETKYEYGDSLGVPTASVSPDGATTKWMRDKAGMTLFETKDEGGYSSCSYDEMGRIVRKKTSSSGEVKEFVYRDASRMPSGKVEGKEETKWEYDALGRPVSAQVPGEGLHKFEWDAYCRMFSHIRPDGITTVFKYAAGLTCPSLVETVLDDGTQKTLGTFEFDPCGRLVKRITGDGTFKEWDYRGGDIVKYSENGNAKSAMKTAYDSGHRKILEQGVDGKHAFAYDVKGRLTKDVGSNGKAATYEYGGDGLLAKKSNPDGSWEKYAYDECGRLTKVDVPNGKGEEKTYDKSGRPAKISNADGSSREFIRDENGRLVATKTTDCNGMEKTARYEYDNAGRQTKLVTADGAEISYIYEGSSKRPAGDVKNGTMTWYKRDSGGKVLAMAMLPYDLFLKSSGDKERDALFAQYTVLSYKFDQFGNKIGKEERPISRALTIK